MAPLLFLVLACTGTPEPAKPGATATESTPGPDTGTATTTTEESTTTASDSAPDSVTDTGTTPTAPAKRPLVGAIRWDAWQEDGWVQEAVETTLGPDHWHARLPWFGEVLDASTVAIDGNDPAVMDAEIAAAADAGLDFWAFVAYPPDEGMSNGLELYLSRPDSTRIGYVLNLQGGWLAYDPEPWDAQVDRYVAHFVDPRYTKVEGDRPLLFLFDTPSLLATTRFGTMAAAGAALEHHRLVSFSTRIESPSPRYLS